jgi:hypothetical protein
MGLFVTFSSEELQEFEQWRQANAAGGQVIVLEPVSRRRPDRFKVWFEKPIAGSSNLRWYRPIQEAEEAATGA